MKRRHFRNPYNYDHKKDTLYENTLGPSMTVPDESYSIKDLLKKHTSGIPVNVDRPVEYDEDPQHEDLDKRELLNMDLVEKEEILKEQKQLQEAIKNRIEENEKAKAAINELNEKRTKQETIPETSENPSIQEDKKQEEN